VLSGQSAIYNFTATPTSSGTFGANVTFSCSGLPDATVSCNFNPTQINALSGSTGVQVTITTTGPNAAGGDYRIRRVAGRNSPWLPLTLPLAGMVMVGFAARRMSKYSAIAGACLALALLGLLVACGGGSSAPPPIAVSVSQGTPASVFPNDAADHWPAQTAQFTATVANSTQGVTWTASSGTITANPANPLTATYTAPSVAAGLPPSVTITATSQADPTKFGLGAETLAAATIPGTYNNIMVTATESVTVNSVPVKLTVQ
jgi:hypothetical protein